MTVYRLPRYDDGESGTYVPKFNSTNETVEAFMNLITATIPGLPASLNISKLYRALFGDGPAVIDELSCVASIDGDSISLSPGWVYLPGLRCVVENPSTQSTNLVLEPDGVYYITFDIIGTPRHVSALDLGSEVDAIYSVTKTSGVLDPFSLERLAAVRFNLATPLKAVHGGTGLTVAATDGSLMRSVNIDGQLTWELVEPGDEGQVLSVVGGVWAAADATGGSGGAGGDVRVIYELLEDISVTTAYDAITSATAHAVLGGAGALQVGDILRFRAAGFSEMTEAGTALTFKLEINSTTILTLVQSAGTLSGGRWWLEADVIVRETGVFNEGGDMIAVAASGTLTAKEPDDTDADSTEEDAEFLEDTAHQVFWSVTPTDETQLVAGGVTTRTATLEWIRPGGFPESEDVVTVSRVEEVLAEELAADTPHTLPGGLEYVLDETGMGAGLAVYVNGLLRKPGTSGADGHYAETSTTSVTFFATLAADDWISYWKLGATE